MNPWRLLAHHPRIVARTQAWPGLLGASYREWSELLRTVDNPVGLPFLADFGAGVAEYQLAMAGNDYLAVALEGTSIRPLNATEAEFQCLDRLILLQKIAEGSHCTGTVQELNGGLVRVGHRRSGSTILVVLAAPAGLSLDPVVDAMMHPKLHSAMAILALVPEPTAVDPALVRTLHGRRVALGALPIGAAWAADWRPMLEQLGGHVVAEPTELLGDQMTLVVDEAQGVVSVHGAKLAIHAASQPFLLVQHLARRRGQFVTNRELANEVLAASGDRTESKIVADVIEQFVKKASHALAGRPVQGNPKAFFEKSGDRVRLALSADVVCVIRAPSEG